MTAPLASSNSFPQLSQTSTVFRAIREILLEIRGETEQCQKRLLFGLQPRLSGWKVGDRCSLEILVDDRRRNVRRTTHRRRIAELRGDVPHHGGDGPLAVRLAPGEFDRREQRPAPGAEVLCRELVSETLLHVLVQRTVREVAEPFAVVDVTEDAATGKAEQFSHRGSEGVVDEGGLDLGTPFAEELEPDSPPAHGHVPLPQGRDPVGARPLRMAVRARAEPAQVDQTDGHRADPLTVELVALEIFGHRCPKLRELLAETDQLLELRPLLRRTEVGVVQVLLPPGAVVPGRLQLRAG